MATEIKSAEGITSFRPGWGTIASAGFGLLDFWQQKKEGAGFLEAASSATINMILPEIMGGWTYGGLMLAQGLASVGVSAYENATMQLRQLDKINRDQRPFQNYTFVDGPQVYTMRQAGMALAKQSKYNLQQTMMGDEARFMHR